MTRLKAVTYLHEKDIAHRNLTCDNILFDKRTKQIKITNFLCATETIDSLRRKDFNYTRIADFHYQESKLKFKFTLKLVSAVF